MLIPVFVVCLLTPMSLHMLKCSSARTLSLLIVFFNVGHADNVILLLLLLLLLLLSSVHPRFPGTSLRLNPVVTVVAPSHLNTYINTYIYTI
jgi:hypothetical protein